MSDQINGAAAISSAGSGAGGDGQKRGSSLASFVDSAKRRMLTQEIEIMPGLTFHQFDVLKMEYFYLNSKFIDGPLDENGQEKFFHNLIVHRNEHIAKNLDIDLKDMYIDSPQERGYWYAFLLKNRLIDWAKSSGFSKLLNEGAQLIPDHGTLVWTKKGTGENTRIENVELRNIITDPSAFTIDPTHEKGSKYFIVQHIMEPWELREQTTWDQDAVEAVIKKIGSGTSRNRYLEESQAGNIEAKTDTSAEMKVFEAWAWIPETFIPQQYWPKFGIKKEPSATAYRYAMFVVADKAAAGDQDVLFCKPENPKDFPYRDCHRKNYKGRWKRESNTERLFPLQIRANELVNRFFASLRIGSLHLYQTRGPSYAKNLFTDLEDGAVVETRDPIEPIATEIRAFNQYQVELRFIEQAADKISNSFEVITGEALPAATPFRLGAQIGEAAGKGFKFIQEDYGLFISSIFQDWILPALEASLSTEYMLTVVGSTEELKRYDEAIRNSVLFGRVKDFVLKEGSLPTQQQLDLAIKAISEQMDTGERKIKINEDFFKDVRDAQIRFSVTDEAIDRRQEVETYTNLLAMIAQNPAILQIPDARMIIGRLMTYGGLNPMVLPGFVSAPQPAPVAPEAAPPEEMKRAAPARNPTGQNIPAPNALPQR